jgi:ribonuclease HIII
MQGSNSYKVDLHQQGELQSELKRAGFRFSRSQHSFWRASDGRYTLTLYHSGKFLIQGKAPERVARSLRGKGFILSASNPIATERQGISKWIGTDESGKGDYFGPLVIAGVLLTSETRKGLIALGVKDSKRLSNRSIDTLAPRIKDLCPHSIIVISSSLYNRAYETLRGYGKLSRILAWGHTHAIKKILDKEECHYAIVDQFARKIFMEKALMNKGIHIALEQRFHAENNIAVAAASILAHNAYKEALATLSIEHLIILPPGASDKVIDTGRQFVLRYGVDKLKEVAKFHFATTHSILEPEMAREPESTDFTPDYFISIDD